ncbi:MAG: lipid-A-disaccharide synthase-related protein [Dictyoglomus sp.]|nr:lipid-A-disaccharide synthase-related protein [Dictyoglomus sp.]MCX7942806.1 lipid-A-disaccharide synthase-related protein [Dictyoglomaceae bacterium]MDW8188386.1 lipid-A-disaccharide synthase-related protein [Dictyoglomus sp.]
MLLFISNGFGEDLIAREIIKNILEIKDIKIFVLPLVGEGKAYLTLPIEILNPRRDFPSGGFAFRSSLKYIFKDLRNGLFSFQKEQLRTLRSFREKKIEVVCIGDTYNLVMGSFTQKRPFFLPTAKSILNSSFYFPEIYLMKKLAKFVFTRDEPTYKYLKNFIPQTFYLGNPMFDGLENGEEKYEDIIALLPGSREESIANIELMLKACEIVFKEFPNFRYVVIVSPYLPEKCRDYFRNIIKKFDLPVTISFGNFSSIVKKAYIILGLAGTANEQAVFLKKLVVSFPGKGPQITSKFLKMQKALLGEGLEVVNNYKEAGERIIYFIKNPEEVRLRGEKGRERLGDKGADKIAKFILENINL